MYLMELLNQMVNDEVAVSDLSSVHLNEWYLTFVGELCKLVADILKSRT